MKTIEQTNRYLSTCIFDDDSWEHVLSFCREQYGGGKVHRPRRGQYHTTFADFATWFNYLPGQGDIVRYGNIVGMVGKCTSFSYSLCIYIGQHGQLIQRDLIVYPHHLATASPDESSMLMSKMFDARITYSISLGIVTKMFIPSNGDFVTVRHLNSTKHGIFDRMESSNCVFYYLDNKESVVKPAMIPYHECNMEASTSKKCLELLKRLSRLGVMWNPRRKEFLPVPVRAELGDKYWYMNDRFEICQCKDMRTPVHDARYKNGNYFTSYGEALVFLGKVKEMCAFRY